MSRKTIVIISLMAVLLVLVVYFLFIARQVDDSNQAQPMADREQDKMAKIRDEYKAQTKVILFDYLNIIGQENFTQDQLKQIKDRLLELKVPTEFRELHIDLVLSLTKMENYLTTKDEKEKVSGQQLVNQARANYSWLNQ